MIRRGKPTDYSTYLELWPDFESTWPSPSEKEFAASAEKKWIVDEEDGLIRGFIRVTPSVPCGTISDLVVRRANRRAGIGRTLILAARRILLTHGVSECSLLVKVDNHDAIRLYERLEFRQTSILELLRIDTIRQPLESYVGARLSDAEQQVFFRCFHLESTQIQRALLNQWVAIGLRNTAHFPVGLALVTVSDSFVGIC